MSSILNLGSTASTLPQSKKWIDFSQLLGASDQNTLGLNCPTRGYTGRVWTTALS